MNPCFWSQYMSLWITQSGRQLSDLTYHSHPNPQLRLPAHSASYGAHPGAGVPSAVGSPVPRLGPSRKDITFHSTRPFSDPFLYCHLVSSPIGQAFFLLLLAHFTWESISCRLICVSVMSEKSMLSVGEYLTIIFIKRCHSPALPSIGWGFLPHSWQA